MWFTKLKHILKMRELTPLYMLIIVFSAAGFVNNKLLTVESIANTLAGSSLYILLAVGISFVIMIGEIDVSIGATLGLCASIAGVMIRDKLPMPLIFFVVIMSGALIGAINAVGVVDFKVSSIIMTLGMMGIIRGILYIYTSGRWVENIPDIFKQYAQKNIFSHLNLFFCIAMVIAVLGHFLHIKTKIGSYFKAVGDNLNAAILVGIPVNMVKRAAFVLSGVFAALASIMFVARVGFVAPVAGTGYEMTVIAGCILGGISLSGGVGSILGSAFGVMIITSSSRILVFLGFSSDFNNTIVGALLIIIVVSDALLQKHFIEKTRRERLQNRFLEELDHE